MPPSPPSSRDAAFDRSGRRHEPGAWSAASADGVVTAAHYLAATAGAEALRVGGNAIDAAIATSLALGVCEPAASGLGGMALMLVHDASSGRTFGLESPCRAPRTATPEAVAAGPRYRGYRAVAVPGLPRLLQALEPLAALPRARLVEPALRLCEDGFPITAMQSRLIEQYRAELAAGSAGATFLRDGAPLPAGTLLRQPELARTLQRLIDDGFGTLHDGALARELAADIQRGGGFVDRRDLQAVPAPRESRPLRTPWRGARLCTLGPPAGGTALVQMLAMVTSLPPLDLERSRDLVRIAAIIRRARDDRRRLAKLMRADDVGGAAVLLDPDYARRATAEALAAAGAGETSHVSIADRHGNAVALTQSVERSFGAAELAGGLGILCNGYLRAFKVAAHDHPHFLQPGAVARSNAAPSIAVRDGRAITVLGSTGSERMASGMLETLLRLQPGRAFEACHGARMHCTPEGRLLYEDRLPEPHLAALRTAGFALEPLEAYAFKMGGQNLVVRERGAWVGVSDPRRDGAARTP